MGRETVLADDDASRTLQEQFKPLWIALLLPVPKHLVWYGPQEPKNKTQK